MLVCGLLLGALAAASEIPSDALEKAMLADAAYGGKQVNGYTLISHSYDSWTGFECAVYQKEGTGERVLAFAGTDPTSGLDWLTDGEQLLDGLQPQYWEALRATVEFREQAAKAADGPHNVSTTGHSLGGGLAQFVAMVTGTNATVFNPAGLGPGAAAYIASRKLLGLAPNKPEIHEIRTMWDRVSLLGWQPGNIHTLADTFGAWDLLSAHSMATIIRGLGGWPAVENPRPSVRQAAPARPLVGETRYHIPEEDGPAADRLVSTPERQFPGRPALGPPPANTADFGDVYAGLDHRLWHIATPPDNPFFEHIHDNFCLSGRPFDLESATAVANKVVATNLGGPPFPPQDLSFSPDVQADAAAMVDLFRDQAHTQFGEFDSIHTLFHVVVQHAHARLVLGCGGDSSFNVGHVVDARLAAMHEQLHQAQGGGPDALETWFHSNFCAGAGSVGNQDLETLHDTWHRLIGVPDSGTCLDGEPRGGGGTGETLTYADFGAFGLGIDHRLWHLALGTAVGEESFYHVDVGPFGSLDSLAQAEIAAVHIREVGLPGRSHDLADLEDTDPTFEFVALFQQAPEGADRPDAIMRILHASMQHVHGHVDPESPGHPTVHQLLDGVHSALHAAGRDPVALETWFHSNFCGRAGPTGNQDLEALHDAWHRLLGVSETTPGMQQTCAGVALPPPPPATAADFGDFYAGVDHRLWALGFPARAFGNTTDDPTGSPESPPHDLLSAIAVTGHVHTTHNIFGPVPEDLGFTGGASTPSTLLADTASFEALFRAENNDFRTFDSLHSAFHVALQHAHAHYHGGGLGSSRDNELIAIHDGLHAAQGRGPVGLETWFHSNFCQHAASSDEDLTALHDTWHRLLGTREDATGMQQTCTDGGAFGDVYAGLDHRLWHIGFGENEFFHASEHLATVGGGVAYEFPLGQPIDEDSAFRAGLGGTHDNAEPEYQTFTNLIPAPGDNYNNIAPVLLFAHPGEPFFDPSIAGQFGSFDALHRLFHNVANHASGHYHLGGLGDSMDARLVAAHEQLHAAEGNPVALENWFHSNFCAGAGPAGNQDLEALHDAWHRLLGVPKDAPGMTAT